MVVTRIIFMIIKYAGFSWAWYLIDDTLARIFGNPNLGDIHILTVMLVMFVFGLLTARMSAADLKAVEAK